MPNKPRRRDDDPPEIDMAPVRAENRDIWAKAQGVYEHYKLAWAFWILFATALAWGIKHIYEPLAAVPDLQAQVARQNESTRANFDTVKSRLDEADASRKDIVQVLKVFGKFICIQMTPTDRYKYDVKCGDLPRPEIKTRGSL